MLFKSFDKDPSFRQGYNVLNLARKNVWNIFYIHMFARVENFNQSITIDLTNKKILAKKFKNDL